MLSRNRKSVRILRFNMTPMIDVVLQLMIFFMYTSQFAQLSRTKMDLPEQPGEEINAASEPAVVLDLEADGSLSVAGESMTNDRLARLIEVEAQRFGGVEELDVLVRADRATSTQTFNALLLRLRDMGVVRWRLGATEPVGGVR